MTHFRWYSLLPLTSARVFDTYETFWAIYRQNMASNWNMKSTNSGFDPRQYVKSGEGRKRESIEESDIEDMQMLVEDMTVAKKTCSGSAQYAGATPGRVKERQMRKSNSAAKKKKTRQRKKMSMYNGKMHRRTWRIAFFIDVQSLMTQCFGVDSKCCSFCVTTHDAVCTLQRPRLWGGCAARVTATTVCGRRKPRHDGFHLPRQPHRQVRRMEVGVLFILCAITFKKLHTVCTFSWDLIFNFVRASNFVDGCMCVNYL